MGKRETGGGRKRETVGEREKREGERDRGREREGERNRGKERETERERRVPLQDPFSLISDIFHGLEVSIERVLCSLGFVYGSRVVYYKAQRQP